MSLQGTNVLSDEITWKTREHEKQVSFRNLESEKQNRPFISQQ